MSGIATEKIIAAAIAAFENADHVPLYTPVEQSAHRAGVRDMLVRLGLYDEFVCRDESADHMAHPDYREITIEGCRLQMTCGSCPEQYWVFLGEARIGYLSVRHGAFTAHYQGADGMGVYSAGIDGDGTFADHERGLHLRSAVSALLLHHNGGE